MKRIALIFCVCLFALSIQAQGAETIQKTTTHLKFMGIEINGTLSEFEKKLSYLGIVPYPNNYDKIDGERYYDGDFWGEYAIIVIYYSPRSEIVHKANVIILRDKEKEIKKIRATFEHELDLEYGKKNKDAVKGKFGENYEYTGFLYNLDNGLVSISSSPVSYPSNVFKLQVEYLDKMNYSIYLQEEKVDVK